MSASSLLNEERRGKQPWPQKHKRVPSKPKSWAVTWTKTPFLSTCLRNEMQTFIRKKYKDLPLPPGKHVFLKMYKIKMHLFLFTSGELEFKKKRSNLKITEL